VKYTPLKFLRIQINQQGVMDDEDDYTGISTKNQDAYVHFERLNRNCYQFDMKLEHFNMS